MGQSAAAMCTKPDRDDKNDVEVVQQRVDNPWAAGSRADVHHFENGVLVGEVGSGSRADVAPWAPAMVGPTLITPAGEKSTAEVLANKKNVALLFAGSWCPWCKALDPKLKDLYTKLKAMDPNDTEVVFLSTCADKDAFKDFQKTQPWAAVPFDLAQGENGKTPIAYVRKAKRDAGKPQGVLGAKFKLASVPQLIVLDGKTGNVVCEKPMEQVGSTAAEGFLWSDLAPASWVSAATGSRL
mmetsp:Transcript_62137/g.133609  ORF Transcript_62137/g.133609 Transcript_62137/m.133609 type:complete len:240 (+) Transcript_62137:89-808(+)